MPGARKRRPNHRKEWTEVEDGYLKLQRAKGTGWVEIAQILQRTPQSLRSRMQALKEREKEIQHGPTQGDNQS